MGRMGDVWNIDSKIEYNFALIKPALFKNPLKFVIE